MAHPQVATSEITQVYCPAFCPQPIAAPLCFGVDGMRNGTALWGQSFTFVPATSQVASSTCDWGAMCMPLDSQCPYVYPSMPQFAVCIVPPMCCPLNDDSATAAPPLLPEFCPSMDLMQMIGAIPATVTSPENNDSICGQDLTYGTDSQTTSNMENLPLERPMLAPQGSRRWADIVDDEASPREVQPVSLTQQEQLSSSAARRRRRQRTAELEQTSVAAAPVQQSMQTEMQNKECETGNRPRSCVQKLADWVVEQMGAGGCFREAAVGSVYQLSTSDKDSCRAMQLALESAPAKDAVALACGLRGHVREVIRSMHGNYVLQKIIEVVPASVACFIAEELRGVAAEVSRHRFGCRVLCRLLEHLSPSDYYIRSLVDEILTEASSLCRHCYGNFVVQHILEFSLADQQHEVVLALSKDLSTNARNQYASHGIEKALTYCPSNDRDALLEDLFQASVNLLELADHQFGCYVVRALLKLPEGHLSKVEDRLRPIVAQLGNANRRQRRIKAGIADRASRASGAPIAK